MLIPKRIPTLPGKILKEHYLKPRGVNITVFAKAVGCSRKHISMIMHGDARIEAPLATKIARILQTTPQFWLNLQNAVDLFRAEKQIKHWKPTTVFSADVIRHSA